MKIMFPINFKDLFYRIICNMTLSCHEKQQLLQEISCGKFSNHVAFSRGIKDENFIT
jgi:hypothetical protein